MKLWNWIEMVAVDRRHTQFVLLGLSETKTHTELMISSYEHHVPVDCKDGLRRLGARLIFTVPHNAAELKSAGRVWRGNEREWYSALSSRKLLFTCFTSALTSRRAAQHQRGSHLNVHAWQMCLCGACPHLCVSNCSNLPKRGRKSWAGRCSAVLSAWQQIGLAYDADYLAITKGALLWSSRRVEEGRGREGRVRRSQTYTARWFKEEQKDAKLRQITERRETEL